MAGAMEIADRELCAEATNLLVAAMNWQPSTISSRSLGATLQLDKAVVQDIYGGKRSEAWTKVRKELLLVLPHLKLLAKGVV